MEWTDEKILHWPDIRHAIRMRWRSYEGRVSWINWELFEHTAWDMEGKLLGYPLLTERGGYEYTLDLDRAEVAAGGYVKFDGCLEVELDEHYCGPVGLADMLEALRRIYPTAAEIFPSPLYLDEMTNEKA